MLCIVGDQSSGKSSLLEALTGVSFPVKSGTCTRMPITVRCRTGQKKASGFFLEMASSGSWTRLA